MKTLAKCFVILGLLFLLSCTTPEVNLSAPVEVEPHIQPPEQSEDVVSEPMEDQPDPFLRARILADILYDAKMAFDDNRLMSPEDDNAYARYVEVLELDPGNTVAIEGLDEIVSRYLELAGVNARKGKYDSAESMLNNAISIRPGNNVVKSAMQALDEARKIRVDFFQLESQELELQSTVMLVRLSEIAEHVKKTQATFLITARTDSEGRWIYKIMREAVGGYRLRGNIELGNEPGIQVNIPNS